MALAILESMKAIARFKDGSEFETSFQTALKAESWVHAMLLDEEIELVWIMLVIE